MTLGKNTIRMVNDQNYSDKLNELFNPKHIAFIGASENSAMGSMLYLPAFRESKWNNTFYPVNPKHEKIFDWKCYQSILDIPFPVDTAYISLKTQFIPQIVKECVDKKVRWLIIFASGYSETRDLKGKEMERDLIKIIKNSNSRIIGPNCLGPFNAENGMAFSFSAPRGFPGSISFMSQSGGHLTQLLDVAFNRDLRFRYGVSFGNQIDLNCVNFLRFFREDPKTNVIVAYLESFGSANGHEFFEELKKTTKKKPVIIWKGGYTEDGSRAAFSHTGAIASNMRLWKTMIKQTGATLVFDNEQLWNTMKTFELLFPTHLPKDRNVGIITPGGGSSVNMTDLFASYNLKVPVLAPESQEKISNILPDVNVNVQNPIDLGASGFVIDVFLDCINIIVDDSNINVIVVPLWPHHIYGHVFKKMIKIQKRTSKPFAFILPSIGDNLALAQRFDICKKIMHEDRVLYYLSLRDAAKSLSLFCDYADFLKSHDTDLKKN